jgi:ubiquinone/menaquinone biosynthesis C-methylase UbiE
MSHGCSRKVNRAAKDDRYMTSNSDLYLDPDLVRFYDLENGWGDDTRLCATMAAQTASVLDLGCGTGLLLSSLPGTIQLTGVDPAAAMLDVARKRPGGRHVTGSRRMPAPSGLGKSSTSWCSPAMPSRCS